MSSPTKYAQGSQCFASGSEFELQIIVTKFPVVIDTFDLVLILMINMAMQLNRVAEVVRRQKGPSPKSLDLDKSKALTYVILWRY